MKIPAHLTNQHTQQRRELPGFEQTPQPPAAPAEQSDLFKPSEPQEEGPSLGRAVWNGAKKGTMWTAAVMAPMYVAGAIMEGVPAGEFVAGLCVAVPILSATIGGTSGAAIGAVAHQLKK